MKSLSTKNTWVLYRCPLHPGVAWTTRTDNWHCPVMTCSAALEEIEVIPKRTAEALAERVDDAVRAYFSDDDQARERFPNRLEALDDALDEYREDLA